MTSKDDKTEVKAPTKFNWFPPVNIKSNGGEFIYPRKATKFSIGYDLCVPETVQVPARSRVIIPLNFAIELPLNVEAKIEPRSGFSVKGMEGVGKKTKWMFKWGFLPWCRIESGIFNYDADVIPGKIDPGYKGTVGVILKNNGEAFTILKGTRIAQMTFYRTLHVPVFRKVEELTGYDRGGGFGSTGSTEFGVEKLETSKK